MRVTLIDAAGNTDTIYATPNHPYLMAANDNDGAAINLVKLDPGGNWTAAGFLQPGDTVRGGEASKLTVVSVELDPTPTRVYNFEVEDHHTYAVGHLRAWVHNARGFPGHTQSNHIKKRPGKSTFKKPSGVIKLIRRTLASPNCVVKQTNGNTRFTKQFGRQTGRNRNGNPVTGVTVIVSPGGKIITAFPR